MIKLKKVLIIQTAFLGDVILATPVVTELKRLFPDAKIDFLLKKGNESLLENNPHLRTVHIFDKSTGKFKSMWASIKTFRKERYDLVINLHRFGSSGLITVLSGGKLKYGFKKNPFSFFYTRRFEHEIGNGKHEVERNLSIIAEFGAQKLVRPELFPSTVNKGKVDALALENYSCFAPASVWFTKQLPERKWIELLQKVADASNLVLIGGPADVELCDRIIAQSGVKAINLAGKLNLLESADLMSKAKMNFVNDSGPLHLASAMNAPTTAFFCSTVPSFGFGPLSDNSRVLQKEEKLDCRPCGLHGHKECPKGHFKCGDIDLKV